MAKIKTIVITGPTATGKTALAVELARKLNSEIISIDSRQVYRHLDIGSGKDVNEYLEGGKPVRCHLLDVADPGREVYDLAKFLRQAGMALRDIAKRGMMPICCGGTTMYLDGLLRNYQLQGAVSQLERQCGRERSLSELEKELKERYPERAAEFKDWGNLNRVCRALEIASNLEKGVTAPELDIPELDALTIGVYCPRKTVHERIAARLQARLDNGLIEEVRWLHDEYAMSYENLEYLGLEYREVAKFLQGEYRSKEELFEKLLYKIRQFAKRQDIWFRKMEREGRAIYWLPEAGRREAMDKLVRAFIRDESMPEPELRLSEIFYGPQTN